MANVSDILSSLKDVFVDPIKDAVLFRARNVFFGSFVLSWIVVNWDKLAYFIFSNDDILRKILIVKSEYPVSGEAWYVINSSWHYFFLPLLAAVLYVLLYPCAIYSMGVIHRGILKRIDTQKNDTETDKIQSRANVVEAQQAAEDMIEEAKAKRERNIEQYREDALKSKRTVASYLEEVSKLKEDLSAVNSELTSTRASFEEAKVIRDSINAEILSLNKDKLPLQENADLIKRLRDELYNMGMESANKERLHEQQLLEAADRLESVSWDGGPNRRLREENSDLQNRIDRTKEGLVELKGIINEINPNEELPFQKLDESIDDLIDRLES